MMNRLYFFSLLLGLQPMCFVAAEQEATDHWSFQPVKRPVLPGGKGNPVDGFLDRRLQQEAVPVNGPADSRSLIRRVSVVLTGLPPQPARVKAFERAFSGDADKAYMTLVDELLASPHFGERWAQHWLDVIRWAETNGSESNLYRKLAWVYRDYVIRCFNEDKPYDRFVREQLAGDTMGAGDATGFLVAGPHVPAATVGQEATAIRQARADRRDEIMQTVGASFMGITIGCARCHDHKFDPLSIQDYYAMSAVFQDIEFGSRYPEFSDDHPRKKRSAELWRQVAGQRSILYRSGPWQEDWGGYRELHFPAIDAVAVRISFKSPSVGIDELEIFGPGGEANLNLALASRGTKVSGPGEMVHDGRNRITRINDGEYGTMAWRARAPNKSKDRPWAILSFDKVQKINRLRISSNREYYFETDYLTSKPGLSFANYEVEVQGKDGKWKQVASTWWIENGLNKKQPARAAAVKKLRELAHALAEEGPRPSFVGRFSRPKLTHVLSRGSPENPAEEVMPAAPAILSGDLNLTSANSGRKRRARFADWVVDPKNPLTARVMVNRIWHHVFGAGIVVTGNDFGAAGALPTHPGLLDWLAAEFIQPAMPGLKPWSVKDMIRLMVSSNAFRRSSAPPDDWIDNEGIVLNDAFLWRYPPRRVEAEVIRDGILQASGRLDDSMGGRSYRIHNVKKTYAQWQVVDNHGPDTWRRMIYQERMRRVDDRIFTAFDFPDCGQVRAKRPVSTTPLQALNLMNSDFVVGQTGLIAERALQESGTSPVVALAAWEAAVRRCFELLLARHPDADELRACVAVSRERGLQFVCRALINSNEFAFLP
jgi:hypothetical protein